MPRYAGLQLEPYTSAQLHAAFEASHTFARAGAELDELLGDWATLSKPVQAAVLNELIHAISSSTR